MWSLIDLLFPRVCCGCGTVGKYLCPSCRSNLTNGGIVTFKSNIHQGHLSIFRYRGPIKQVLSDLKFHFVTDLCSELVDLLAHKIINSYPHLLRYWQEESFVIVPIPLHPSRHSWRGFNQSELVSQQLSKILHLSYSNSIIKRNYPTPPQSLIKNRSTRRQLLTGTFSTTRAPPSHVLLFDDVYTSGATVNSVISALPKETIVWSMSVAG